MDEEFDRALQALAELQIKYGIPNILLSMQDPAGDVVATLRQPKMNSFKHYARIAQSTKQLVHLRP